MNESEQGDLVRREVADSFAALARLIHQDPGRTQVCQAVVDAAPRFIPGCDHASIMVIESRRFRTLSSSDEIGEQVDRLEREVGSGPCVDAIISEAYQLDPDITVRSQWPTLAARVLAETPVRGMAGYRLIVDGRKTGALNLFSDTAGALTREAADSGAVLASFASVALTSVAHRTQVTTLQQGLASNREIGIAVGLLMAAHGLSAEAAFATLRTASSQLNRKIAAIAHELIERGPDLASPPT